MTVYTETWTGTSGAAWPAQWVDGGTSDGTGTSNIYTDGAQGRITAGGAGWSDTWEFLDATITDLDVTFQVDTTIDDYNEMSFHFMWRNQGDGTTSARLADGYTMLVNPLNQVVEVYAVQSFFPQDETPIATDNIGADTGSVVRWYRVQHIGNAIKVKTWLDGVSEPGAWNIEVTNSAHTAAGRVALGVNNGNTSATRTVLFDDFTLDDQDAGGPGEKSTTGTLSTSLASTGVVAKTAGSSGAVALNVAPTDDVAKTGQTAGAGTISIDAAGEAFKLVAAAGATGISLTADGTTAKIGTAAGDVALILATDGDAVKNAEATGALALVLDLDGTVEVLGGSPDTTGAVALALAALGTAAKVGNVAGAVALALAVSGDTAKLASVAGSVGLTLAADGTVANIPADTTFGAVALSLAAVAVASKVGAVVGGVGISLAVAGTTAKAGGTAGSVSVALAISAISGIVVPLLVRPSVVAHRITDVTAERTTATSAARATAVTV